MRDVLIVVITEELLISMIQEVQMERVPVLIIIMIQLPIVDYVLRVILEIYVSIPQIVHII